MEKHALKDSEMMVWAWDENGNRVHIDSVARGLACKCHCPGCNAPLEAKKGNHNKHSFAHAAGFVDCQHWYESDLHLRAKKIIEQEKKICFPAFTLNGCSDDKVSYFCTNDVLERKGINQQVQVTECVDAESEVFIPEFNIKPDVLVHLPDGKSLMVEIFVTHAVDLEKQANIEASGISAIEIDFSQCDRNMTDDELRHYLCESAELTHWCYNAEQDDHNKWYAEWNKNVEKKKLEVLNFDKDWLQVGSYLPFFWKVKSVDEWMLLYAQYCKLQVGTPESNQRTFNILFNGTKSFCSVHKIDISDEQIKNACVAIINNTVQTANARMANMQFVRPVYSYSPRVNYQKPRASYNGYRHKQSTGSYGRRKKH